MDMVSTAPARTMAATNSRARRRQPPEETRQQIVDAARGLLGERSYRDLSVDAVMAVTGHTRTLFYRHFDGIPALMLALIEEASTELIAVAQEWIATESKSPQEARRRLAVFVDYHTRNAASVRGVVEAAHHDDEIERAYAQMVEGFVTITTLGIQSRVDAGELEPIDVPETARALVQMLNGYLSDPMRTDDPERALDALWVIWTRTLFPGVQI